MKLIISLAFWDLRGRNSSSSYQQKPQNWGSGYLSSWGHGGGVGGGHLKKVSFNLLEWKLKSSYGKNEEATSYGKLKSSWKLSKEVWPFFKQTRNIHLVPWFGLLLCAFSPCLSIPLTTELRVTHSDTSAVLCWFGPIWCCDESSVPQ